MKIAELLEAAMEWTVIIVGRDELGEVQRAVQCGGIGMKTGGMPGKLERRLIAASSDPWGFR